uniref:Chorismate lyase n=1 Tax=Dictyurus purpurascens TaxID=189649 RepID=A0A4D6WTG8_9FLOR|nr:hypothetical protein [Dictyurus purpurascens]
MDQNIYTFHKFHSVFILPIKKNNYLRKKLLNIIKLEWKLILINEGSLTQVLHSLSGNKLKIQMFQKSNKYYKNIRSIWLEDSLYTKLIFARSMWMYKYINEINNKIKNKKPLGKSIIISQIDILRKIHEINYGYCQYLEYKFQSNIPIWGRKYTLYYNNKAYITVQEFFSPYIANFFK